MDGENEAVEEEPQENIEDIGDESVQDICVQYEDQQDVSTSESTSSEISRSPVKTRNGRTVWLPARFQDYVSVAMKNNEQDTTETTSFSEAMSSKDSELWRESMSEEFKNLQKNKTWEVVYKLRYKNILGCRWVYKRKKGNDGRVCRYRS